MKPKEVLEFAKKNGAQFVDLRFIDFPGIWQHTTVPIHRLEESSFEEGFGFDGSSIRGWQPLNASDMIMIPDPESAKMDPFTAHPTVVLTCSIADPITHQPYSRDPRYVAKKAEAYVRQTGLADTIYFGPEAEFFIFDSVTYEQNAFGGSYSIDSEEATWNSGKSGKDGSNLGYKI